MAMFMADLVGMDWILPMIGGVFQSAQKNMSSTTKKKNVSVCNGEVDQEDLLNIERSKGY